MNIFNKVTLEGMKKSRTRTIVTIIGVILSAAMITAVSTFGVSLLNYMIKGAIQKEGDWHVGFNNVSSSFVEECNSDKETEDSIIFEDVGYALFNGCENPDKPYFFIAGFNDKTFDKLPIQLIKGRLPETDSEVIVSLAASANGGVNIDVEDTLSLDVGDRISGDKILNQHNPYLKDKENLVPHENKTYKVVGICQRPSFEEQTAPGYTLITKSDSEETSNSFSLFAKLKNPRNIHKYVEDKASKETYFYNDHVLRFMGLSEDDKVFNALLYSIAAIAVGIIMIGSIFLIHNSFNISLNERTHQFGILASIGATSKQLRNSVVFEGFVIGIIGIPIGTVAGLLGIKVVISAIANNFSNIFYKNVSLDMVISPLAIALAAIVSMVTILISAYIPARKAAKVPVIESIKQTKTIKVDSRDIKTSRLVQRIFGLEGTLALKNFKRNKKRYRSIVLSLVLSIVLFISTNSFVGNLKMSSEKAKVVTDYDIGLVANHEDDDKMIRLYDKFKGVEEVYESSYQALSRYSSNVKVNEFIESSLEASGLEVQGDMVNLPVNIQFIEDNKYKDILKKVGLSEEKYTAENRRVIAVAKMEADGKKELHDMSNIFKNSSMDFDIIPKGNDNENKGDSQKINITFVETVPPDILPITSKQSTNNEFFFNVMAPYSLKKQLLVSDDNVIVKGLTFNSNKVSKTVDEIKTIIKASGKSSDYTLFNSFEATSENRNIIFIVDIFAYIFIIIISLIAVANVFNTISTNIKLRRRELAMLRSVGMSDKDFQKMMNFECVFYGMKAILIGIPLSIASSFGIYKCMWVGGADNIEFVFPWQSIFISMVTVLFVVFITMLYSISKIKKENIIDVLRDDMD